MVALSDRKIEVVRTLVESAPDQIVGGLRQALLETGGDTVLASVRKLVEAEADDRALRNAAFQPIVPLCVGDGADSHTLVFPAQALALVWRGLKAAAPREMAAAIEASSGVAAALASGQRPVDPGEAYDVLTKTAAEGLRAGDVREFRAAMEICDFARPGGGAALAACLDIAPVVRRALPRLPDWVAQPGEDTGAAARLAYKDAVAIAEDAGPRFFEMLAGQLTPPWHVIRIISAIMDRPTERYLANSELGRFPERVLADIDEALKAVSRLDLDAGPQAGCEAGRRVALITQQTFELELCIALSRDHGWGQRIFGQKKALASLAEARLKDAERLAIAALPMQSLGFARRRKKAPKLDERPEPKALNRAMTLLSFAHEVRLCAAYGAFSAVHTRVTDKLTAAIEHYVEDVLDRLRTDDVADVTIAHAFLRVAADFTGLVRDGPAAEMVRRRAATACAPDPTVALDA